MSPGTKTGGAATARMINRPASLDTIVATNLAQQLQ